MGTTCVLIVVLDIGGIPLNKAKFWLLWRLVHNTVPSTISEVQQRVGTGPQVLILWRAHKVSK